MSLTYLKTLLGMTKDQLDEELGYVYHHEFLAKISLGLKEQDRDTRHACAEAVAFLPSVDGMIRKDLAHNTIMNCPNGLKGMGEILTNRPFIYLAGPYSHPDPEVRHFRFIELNKAAGQLMSQGLMVLSPISHSHPIVQCGTLPSDWGYWETFSRSCMSVCHKMVILCMNGWQDSTGVTAEMAIAKEMGMPVDLMEHVLG